MKRLALALTLTILLLIVGLALAQTWHKADSAIVAWDEVTTLETATGPVPLPAGDMITYRVHLQPQGGEPTVLGETEALTYTVQLPAEGRWLAGVSALRWVDGELVGESEVSWSDGEHAAPAPWGLRFHNPPGQVKGLVKQ